jgi:hypothetical protein
LEVFKGAHVPIGEVMGVLDCDDIFAGELVVADEVPPHLGLDVEALDGVPCEDIAGGL